VDLPASAGKPQKFISFQQPFRLGKTLERHGGLFGGYGNSQSLSALGAPSLNNKPAVLAGHPDKKSMGPFT